MKKELFTALSAAALILGVVTIGSAGNLTWTVLEDSSVIGKGPGYTGLGTGYEVIGVPDDVCTSLGAPTGTADDNDSTTGERNQCNLTGADGCTGGPGETGSFSYGVLEMGSQVNSCLGGTTPGAACDTPLELCPDGKGICVPCTTNPDGWDVYFYVGNIKVTKGNGTIASCQDGGAGGTSYLKSMKLGASASADTLSAGCMNLPKGENPTADHCGETGVETTSTMNLITWGKNPLAPLAACSWKFGGTNNNVSKGRMFDVNGTSPTPTCGYTTNDILCLQALAKARKGANYLLISCITSDDVGTQPSACLSGGKTRSVTVSWTKGAATNCTAGSCAGGCGGSMAEDAE